ncbi:MAG: response regulator [Lachnospiraceae bacterium]|nr:response regulator [Lachnospiraceae bacterium]
MLIFSIDDEPLLNTASLRIIREAVPDAEVLTFLRGSDALKTIQENNLRPDIVFSDIQMPGLNGLEFAVKLKTLCPSAKIVFVTGYSEYALDAFKIHAQGYILKPLEADRVREEIAHSFPPPAAASDKLHVQCFGYFDVTWQGQPLTFARRKTKELFAFLIDREGTACTMEDISSALYENEQDLKVTKNRIRVLINDLKSTLSKIRMENVLIRQSGWVAIRRELVDCDYYKMLDGDMHAVSSFAGDYMQQYTWAELTAGKLYLRYIQR